MWSRHAVLSGRLDPPHQWPVARPHSSRRDADRTTARPTHTTPLRGGRSLWASDSRSRRSASSSHKEWQIGVRQSSEKRRRKSRHRPQPKHREYAPCLRCSVQRIAVSTTFRSRRGREATVEWIAITASAGRSGEGARRLVQYGRRGHTQRRATAERRKRRISRIVRFDRITGATDPNVPKLQVPITRPWRGLLRMKDTEPRRGGRRVIVPRPARPDGGRVHIEYARKGSRQRSQTRCAARAPGAPPTASPAGMAMRWSDGAAQRRTQVEQTQAHHRTMTAPTRTRVNEQVRSNAGPDRSAKRSQGLTRIDRPRRSAMRSSKAEKEVVTGLADSATVRRVITGPGLRQARKDSLRGRLPTTRRLPPLDEISNPKPGVLAVSGASSVTRRAANRVHGRVGSRARDR